jgi:glyoxylase-like metal-dependent hydrolase (beta-lactamase superfamily II)
MYDLDFNNFYLHCLAHGSFLIASNETKTAYIVDPRRDVNHYLEQLEAKGLTLAGVLLTHIHADFVSGHAELAARAGVPIYVGANSGAVFERITEVTDDSAALPLSSTLSIQPLTTPGHTLGCVTWLLMDRGVAVKAFTGDTLFVGGAGRPDLVGSTGDVTAVDMANHMYDSLYNKLLALPDDCEVHPAHGPGSPCGNMDANAKLSSTIGDERTNNAFLQFADNKDDFVATVLCQLRPDQPRWCPLRRRSQRRR